MNLCLRLLSLLVAAPLLLSAGIAAAAGCAEPPALPDTTGFAAERAAFGALPETARAERAAEAAARAATWLRGFQAAGDEEWPDLAGVLWRACLEAWQGQTYNVQFMLAGDILAEAEADLAAAAAADPTQAAVRVALGLVLVARGEQRAGAADLQRALALLVAVDAAQPATGADARQRSLRRTASRTLALTCRNLGLWDEAEDALTAMTGREARPVEGVGSLLHGLCLAGRGRTAEAITWAVRMPPIEYRHISASSAGVKRSPGAFGNDWIRAQALLSSGDAKGARAVLGDIDRRRLHALPLGDAYWQDAGLACELAGDEAARRCYERAVGGTALWFARPTEGTTATPLVLGFPAAGVPFFTTGDGAFAGGSPFGYLALQLSLVGSGGDAAATARARERALGLADALLRRGLRPDVVRAIRGRLHLAAGCPHLARPDLEFAHAAFAGQGLTDPGTSQLLGLQELEANRPEAARVLLSEAVDAAPNDPLGWRHLGVVLCRLRDFTAARKALDRALVLDPGSFEGWYNLGVLAWQQGQAKEALVHLEKAWSLEPGNGRVQVMLQTVANALRGESAGQRQPPAAATSKELTGEEGQ